MSWTAGAFLLPEGESVRIEFDWDGSYQGVQFAQARPIALDSPLALYVPGVFEVETTGQRLELQFSQAVRPGGKFWSYSVHVRNTSSSVVFFELTGGEVAP